jgi:hypothetical protein
MMTRPDASEYHTTLARAALALLVGTIVGALLTSGYMVVAELGHPVPSFTAAIRGSAEIFPYAVIAWAMGLGLIAPVPWLILHRRKLRSWPVAAGLGAVLAFLVALPGPVVLHLPAIAALAVASFFGLFGAIVGIVVWRVAYRR